MIAAIILHQMRVFFTGGYRRPREINWLIGMCLLCCTLMIGFTGYSLVFEQLSLWGVKVGGNLSASLDSTIPGLGSFFRHMLLGGDGYNERTLARFYILHAAILPVTLILLITVHIVFIRLHGVTELQFEDEPEDKPKHFNFFPDHLYTEITIGLVLMIILSALASIFPALMGPKANPLITPEEIKPEWFFLCFISLVKIVLLECGCIKHRFYCRGDVPLAVD